MYLAVCLSAIALVRVLFLSVQLKGRVFSVEFQLRKVNERLDCTQKRVDTISKMKIPAEPSVHDTPDSELDSTFIRR